jgi:hypothetical protein
MAIAKKASIENSARRMGRSRSLKLATEAVTGTFIYGSYGLSVKKYSPLSDL